LSLNLEQKKLNFDQIGKPFQPIPLSFDLVKIMNFVVVELPEKKVRKNYDANKKWLMGFWFL
jgi:hypothetical protein